MGGTLKGGLEEVSCKYVPIGQGSPGIEGKTVCVYSGYICAYGCKNGACLPTHTSTCTDSDEGKNPYVKGTVTYNGQTHTDFCHMIIHSGIPSTTKVYEFYCENGIMKEGPITCPTGTSCQNGACVPNQTSLMDALNKLSASLISLIELLKR